MSFASPARTWSQLLSAVVDEGGARERSIIYKTNATDRCGFRKYLSIHPTPIYLEFVPDPTGQPGVGAIETPGLQDNQRGK